MAEIDTNATETGDEKLPKKLPNDTISGTAAAQAEIAEAKQDERPAEGPPEADIGEDDLPAGVVLATPQGALIDAQVSRTTGIEAPVIMPAFNDEHVGQGGTFIIDAKTGERKRAYEAYEVPTGKGDAVKTKYRPIG